MVVSHSVQRGSEWCNHTPNDLRQAGMRFVVAMACFFAGCSPDNNSVIVESNSGAAESSTGNLKFTDNAAARKILEEVEQGIRSKQIASKDQVLRLLELHRRFPNTAEIIKTLTTAYISRKDWLSICELFKLIDRELVDDALFVRSLILSMSFGEAVAFLENKNDRDSEENFLLGYSLYHNGDMQRAIVVLDDFITAPSERLSEAMMIRGLAAIQVEDWTTADSMLTRSLEQQSDNEVALTALARVKRRMGDVATAEKFEEKAIELRIDAAKKETEAVQMSALSMMLSESWQRQDFAQTRAIIGKMMPNADTRTRAILENYLTMIDRHEDN